MTDVVIFLDDTASDKTTKAARDSSQGAYDGPCSSTSIVSINQVL
jgi:hypothetical protein